MVDEDADGSLEVSGVFEGVRSFDVGSRGRADVGGGAGCGEAVMAAMVYQRRNYEQDVIRRRSKTDEYPNYPFRSN